MKIYFDNAESLTATNCLFLSKSDSNDFWLTAPGTRLKTELKNLGIDYYDLSKLDEPGLYFIEVNGDPIWWCGQCCADGGPEHLLTKLPKHIVDLTKNKKLRIIISADREGGGMIMNNRDCFKATHDAMVKLSLPVGSVLIVQGNRKIETQYNTWLEKNNLTPLFFVKYSNHFDKIFIGNNLPQQPIIYETLKNLQSKEFNSLNRTYKVHRSAHLYMLAVQEVLDRGLVSANELRLKDEQPLKMLNIITDRTDNNVKRRLVKDYDSVLQANYPRFVDGDWSVNNAANSVNVDIFKNSLISFVTETKFDEDVVFLTEKVFKCLAYGHPMIVLGSCGTLKALEDLGYRTEFCGLNPDYNNIEDHNARFEATHHVLATWLNFSYEEKINRIRDTLPIIEHNFKLSKKHNLYHESLIDVISVSTEYFND